MRSFVSLVSKTLGETLIDALILNAGVSIAGGTRTSDGFETTFAVNHLAHYLLLRLLLPRLARGAVVVMTTSGTYDPAEKTIIPPPRHAKARLLAYPDLDPALDAKSRIAGGRAYSSSKLCVLLTARALARRREAHATSLSVVAYDPGPTPGTGLVRNTNFAVRSVWWVLGTPLLLQFLHNMNSRSRAGGALAELALGATRAKWKSIMGQIGHPPCDVTSPLWLPQTHLQMCA